MPAMSPRVSVIIPSYNQKHCILGALQSIHAQKCDFAFEVIVIDSTGDDTIETIKQRYPQTRAIALPTRAYPGTARNEGISMARGEIFAFTDTDCVVDPNWLQELVKGHEQGYAVVGGLVKNGTPRSILGTLDFLMEFSYMTTPHTTTEKDHFGTCNVSFLRSVVERYGLFADQVKGSDNMYFRHMHDDGQVFLWQPGAVIWHRNRTQFNKILRNQYDLGVGSAINRKQFDVKGKIFIRWPVLLLLLPFVRMITIGREWLGNSPMGFLKFFLLSPLVFVCLLYYTKGFYHGIRR